MIYYIMPKYVDGRGNCTCIRDENGEEIVSKTIEAVIREHFKNDCIDIKAYKRKCQKILNQKNLSPLYKCQGEIYIPVKVRKPRVVRDGSHGYINMYSILKINDGIIILNDGSKIIFMDSLRCIIKRIKMGRILEEHFKNLEADFNRSRRSLSTQPQRRIL